LHADDTEGVRYVLNLVPISVTFIIVNEHHVQLC